MITAVVIHGKNDSWVLGRSAILFPLLCMVLVLHLSIRLPSIPSVVSVFTSVEFVIDNVLGVERLDLQSFQVSSQASSTVHPDPWYSMRGPLYMLGRLRLSENNSRPMLLATAAGTKHANWKYQIARSY